MTDVQALIEDAGDAGASLALYDWQTEALREWTHHGRRGIVSAVTGAGKTMLGLAAIDRHLAKHRRTAKAVVLIPTIELAAQWHKQLRQQLNARVGLLGGGHGDTLFDCDVLVAVINSAIDEVPEQVRLCESTRPVLLIADECHRYGAPTFSRALVAPWEATLGLSATPERSYDDGMELHVFPAIGQVVYEYTHEHALAQGVIVDFDVAFVGVDFSPREHQDYELQSDAITTARQHLVLAHPELELSSRQFFAKVQHLALDEDPSALAFLSAVAKRRGVLIKAAARLEFVKWLTTSDAWPGKPILFHERIEQCEEIATVLNDAGIPVGAHHSRLGRLERRQVLSDFESGRLRAIVAPKTLDEGIDVPDADVAVIVAGSGVKRQRIQRMGRVLRTSVGKKRASVILIYVRGSREDPNAGAMSDAFAETMEAIDRALWFAWPGGADRILAYLRGEAVKEAGRPVETPAFTRHRQPRDAPPLSHPEELPPTERQLLDLARRGYRGDNPISQAAADRMLAKLPVSRRQGRPPGGPAVYASDVPTFAQMLKRLPQVRRLPPPLRHAPIARLRRDLTERVETEIARIRRLPRDEQEAELIKLKLRRDRLKGELDGLNPGL
jgi:RNA polymerase primary sigma factor